MLTIDVYYKEKVVATYEFSGDNIADAESMAAWRASDEMIPFSHVAARFEDGSRQTTIFDDL